MILVVSNLKGLERYLPSVKSSALVSRLRDKNRLFDWAGVIRRRLSRIDLACKSLVVKVL